MEHDGSLKPQVFNCGVFHQKSKSVATNDRYFFFVSYNNNNNNNNNNINDVIMKLIKSAKSKYFLLPGLSQKRMDLLQRKKKKKEKVFLFLN